MWESARHGICHNVSMRCRARLRLDRNCVGPGGRCRAATPRTTTATAPVLPRRAPSDEASTGGNQRDRRNVAIAHSVHAVTSAHQASSRSPSSSARRGAGACGPSYGYGCPPRVHHLAERQLLTVSGRATVGVELVEELVVAAHAAASFGGRRLKIRSWRSRIPRPERAMSRAWPRFSESILRISSGRITGT